MRSAKSVFDSINRGINESESSFINLISALSPWLAPLPAAWMSYAHMTTYLEFPIPVAIAVAIVVEVLGLSTISTALSFYEHNRRYNGKTSVKRSPLWLVVITYLFYLAIVLTINVLIDAVLGTSTWPIIVARGLLVLMSLPAGMLIGLRKQHYELVVQIAEEKDERKRSKTETKDESAPEPEVKTIDYRVWRKSASAEDVAWLKTASTASIVAKFGINDRTARNWSKYANEEAI